MAIRSFGGDMGADRREALVVPVDHQEVLRPTAQSPLTLVMSDQRDVVRALHDEIKLSDAEIAEATGVAHVVTVRKWRSQSASGEPRNRERIDDLRAIVGLLLNSGYLHPEEIGRFLRSRNADLNYRRPLGVIARGGFGRVREAAERLLERLAGLDDAAAQAAAPAHAALDLPDGMVRVAPSQSGEGNPLTAHPMTAKQSSPEGGDMSTNRRIVSPNHKGGWDVKKPSATRASSHHSTQADARAAARQYLGNEGGGEMITQRRNGKIRAKDTVPAGNDPYPPKG